MTAILCTSIIEANDLFYDKSNNSIIASRDYYSVYIYR